LQINLTKNDISLAFYDQPLYINFEEGKMFTLMNHIIADRNKKDNTESLSVKIEFKDDSSEKLI